MHKWLLAHAPMAMVICAGEILRKFPCLPFIFSSGFAFILPCFPVVIRKGNKDTEPCAGAVGNDVKVIVPTLVKAKVQRGQNH